MAEAAAKPVAVDERGGKMKAELGGVVVLDFGGQYTQLIARRIREQQVFSSILPCTASLEEIQKLEPIGIVLSGGPSSVYDADAPKCNPKVLALGIPVLGICYGMQWITHVLGGKVEKAERREYGRAHLKVDCAGGPESSQLFAGAPATLRIWNSHGDRVRSLPAGFRATGHTENAVAAVEDPQRKIYATQFHVEVKHTERGTELLRNFLFRVCKAPPHGQGIHCRVRRRGSEAANRRSSRRNRLPGARNALSRCHRIGICEGPLSHHQNASQRGRLAGKNALCPH